MKNSTVLITGAARGIGAETARQLAARGARLALVGLEPERLASLAESLGPSHVWAECDVTDQGALDRAVTEAVRALGGLDVVFANAGIAARGPVGPERVEALARTLEVNLVGVVRTVCATLPHVAERRGYFLLMSSAAAIAPLPGMACYAASKAGVEHFANAFRLEVAHRGVSVGVAHPCWVDTDLVRDARADLASFEATLRSLPGPFGTVTPVADCAAALVDAIVRRRRKVFVPRSLAPFAAFRQALTSPLAERISARVAARAMPALERESRALGSAFGRNSVEGERF